MAASAAKIYQEALDLPIDARLLLTDNLLQNTNLPTPSEIDQAWAEEVEQRSQAVETGRAKLILGESVFEKIKQRFSK